MSQILLSILLCCFYCQFVTSQMIVQSPQNQSVCVRGSVNFTCVVMLTSGSLSGASWFTDNGNTDALTQPGHTRTDDSNGRFVPANVTTVLTVTNVSISDNGADYVCVQGINNVRSDTAFLTVLAPPMAAPTITVSTPLSTMSFTVNWMITDPNHNYIITWTNLRTGMMSNMTVPENTISYTVTGLNVNNNYNVSVAANNSCGMNRSDPITVYGIPDAPTNVRITDVNIANGSFIVRWDAVMDLFDVNYTVRWYGEDGSSGTATVNGLSYNVTGLTNNTSYNVTVVANNTCCGAGPVSYVITVIRPPIPTPAATSSVEPSMMITPPTSGPIDEEDDSSNVGVIIGVVVAVVVVIIVVIIIVIVVVYYIKKNKDSTDGDMQELKSPTNTSGSHTASVKPAGNVPHQTAASGEEYAVTTRVTTTKPQQQPPTQEYAVVDKGKKHAAATQGIHYADLQDLPGSGSQPPTNQGPTSTYAMVA